MKFATWNIAGGRTLIGNDTEALRSNYDSENLEYFARELRAAHVNFVGLQEVHKPFGAIMPSQAEDLGNITGLAVAAIQPYGKSHIVEGQYLALANLTSFRLRMSYFHRLPNPGLSVVRPDGSKWISQDVGFLISEVSHPGGEITIANGHMIPFHYFQRSFSEPAFQNIRSEIAEIFMSLAEEPSIVLGDFNYADLSDLFPSIFENHLYTDAFRTSTTPNRGQQDHLLFSRHWNLVMNEVKRGLADHYLCCTELEIKA